MSFSDLYDSGFRKRNEDHFASIVRVAMEDCIITEDEKTFLDRLARKLDISSIHYEEILKDYMSHPINPPVTYEARLERLYDLGRMAFIDHEFNKEEHLLVKLAVGLGFSPNNVKYIVDKALCLINEGKDLDDFKDDMRSMYK